MILIIFLLKKKLKLFKGWLDVTQLTLRVQTMLKDETEKKNQLKNDLISDLS
jgi:hypothetical protein